MLIDVAISGDRNVIKKKRVLPSGKISESMNMSYRYHVVCCVSCRSCMYWKRVSLTSLPSHELAT